MASQNTKDEFNKAKRDLYIMQRFSFSENKTFPAFCTGCIQENKEEYKQPVKPVSGG